ncbi:MAG: hypothetical protein IJF92_02350 [Bacilli bacterium]|nr:hypothetical protein [Bacilli bacterium]
MVTVNLRRENKLKNKLKLSDTKEGMIKALIITGIGVYISGRLSDPSLYDAIKNHKDKCLSIDIKKEKGNDMKKKSKDGSIKENITFEQWFNRVHSDDELEELFVNMDLAMKYIHDRGYCINSFSPKEIEILNNSLSQVKFDTLLKMPRDISDKQELVKEDIYNAAFLQIGAYMNNISTSNFHDQSISDFLSNMQPSFLRDNFESFSPFIPENLFPYYNGVVRRGASVYLHQYIEEKKKRDLNNLEREIGGESGNTNSNVRSESKGRALVKSNGLGKLIDDNREVNSSIYSQLNRADAAFVTAFVIPIVMVLFGAILMITAFVMGR